LDPAPAEVAVAVATAVVLIFFGILLVLVTGEEDCWFPVPVPVLVTTPPREVERGEIFSEMEVGETEERNLCGGSLMSRDVREEVEEELAEERFGFEESCCPCPFPCACC
jgi:hypothetical protein